MEYRVKISALKGKDAKGKPCIYTYGDTIEAKDVEITIDHPSNPKGVKILAKNLVASGFIEEVKKDGRTASEASREITQAKAKEKQAQIDAEK